MERDFLANTPVSENEYKLKVYWYFRIREGVRAVCTPSRAWKSALLLATEESVVLLAPLGSVWQVVKNFFANF